jgi:hypothetical protein
LVFIFTLQDFGQVFTWGCGNDSRLGQKAGEKLLEEIYRIPLSKFGERWVTCIAAGRRHTAAVTGKNSQLPRLEYP